MEIHHSSLNYVPRSKTSQLADGKARTENSAFVADRKNDKTASFDETESTKAPEATAKTQLFFKPPITKPVISLQTENIVSNRPVNFHVQKAINAYKTESHQLSREESTQVVSGVDFFV